MTLADIQKHVGVDADGRWGDNTAKAIAKALGITSEPAKPPKIFTDGRLSPNFMLAEMMVSQTASRRGIDNTPPAAAQANLRALCMNVLEPLRKHFDRPVIVTSGYRSKALNKAIGGSSTSQHSVGEAADFTIPGVSNLDVCRWMERNLNYDQLIYEFGETGWIHVSYREGRLRNQELRAVRVSGRTRYLSGLTA